MDKDELTAWALSAGWRMIAGCPSLTKPSRPDEAVVRLVLKATVVHVENDQPADRLRLVGPFKDDIPGINRCQFFGSFNTSKLSLQLNLKHPTGNDIARQLLAWCDIALDSFTAGTMDALGLGSISTPITERSHSVVLVVP